MQCPKTARPDVFDPGRWGFPSPPGKFYMAMTPSFRIVALPAAIVAASLASDDEFVAGRPVQRMIVDSKPGYPCRISLVDADIGEEVLLLNHEHHAVDSPYRASGPIFVRIAGRRAQPESGEIPDFLRSRLLSIRAYDDDGTLIAADVADGRDLESRLGTLFENPRIRCLHLHNAKTGCFLCRVDRLG
jgi:hypothetical protein